MNYKTYAEAKIANTDCEIVTTGKDWTGCSSFAGVFQKINDGGRCEIGNEYWVVCNPADYCSTLKEFLEVGFKLAEGDHLINMYGNVGVAAGVDDDNVPDDHDHKRYILSAAAINGGCKIPDNAEQWSIHNNTLPLSELSDEQAAQLFNAWRDGGEVEFDSDCGEWLCADDYLWISGYVYRIKPKSKRELFIEKTMTGCSFDNSHSSTVQSVTGQMFDAGARYKDLTQHFGENI